MKILIGGDFSPTEFNFDLFEQGDVQKLYGEEMLSYLAQFDYRVFDFETVFEGKGAPIQKHGPLITTPASTLPGITAIHPDLFVLANNHINNLGKAGIEHTEELLDSNGISYVGAGADLDEARRPLYVTRDGITLGFYACAEHEFNSASADTAGVNPYDPLTTFDDIREMKSRCDYLIVFYHGGLIEYRYPLPGEQRVFHKFVDCGADLVIGQHTHCIGCREVYRGKTLIYGQGDFFFARPTRNEYRYSGLLIEVEASEEGLSVDYDVRVKPENTIRMATPQEKADILGAFEKRSAEIMDPDALVDIYKEHLAKKKYFYLDRLMGKYGRSLVYAGLNKLTGGHYRLWKLRRRFKKTDWLILDNWVSCETHHEIFQDLIEDEWRHLS